ncbi:MAG: amino acid adenylation domain-containing protein [Bacteroidota bacterium]|nr:amino acid adenylation domain-containing protein [Bacteroidota bacterium]
MVEGFTSLECVMVDYDPFAGPELVAVAPATESQKEIWVSCILGGEAANKAFNESVSLKFKGVLHREYVARALSTVTERHEMLRAAFSPDGTQICIFKNRDHPLTYRDISHEPIEQQQEIIARETRHEVLQSFNLISGPLFKSKLLKLSAIDYHLTLTAHHIICDGWSLNIILREFSRLYSAYVKNEFPDLPKAISFSRYAAHQNEFQSSQEYKSVEAYWINQYKDEVPILDLSTDFERPHVRTYSSGRVDHTIENTFADSLKRLSNQSGCSFVTTLITAFEVFLHRLTGQHTLVIGLPVAGQAASDNYHLVGHCVNLLPLKSTVNGKATFIDQLKQRKTDLLNAFDNQQVTFGSLLKKLNIPRDASRIALVPVVFNVDIGMLDGVEFDGLEYEFKSNPKAFETFEILLNISGSEKSLIFEWSYNTSLFQAQTINHMMEGFKNILKSVIENPSIAIEDISLNNKHGLSMNTIGRKSATAFYPKEKSIHRLISETADKHANKTALVFGERKVSYKELNRTSNQFAHYLIGKGIKAGDVVGVALDRSPEMLISLLAIMKTGAAFVPLDVAYPTDRIHFMLNDTSARCIITNRKYRGNYNAGELFIEDLLPVLASFSKDDVGTKVSSDTLAYILYTSGSTGKPKGVLIKHRNLVNMLSSLLDMPGITQRDVLLAVTTISFDIAYVELFLPLIAGATIVLADATAARNGRELLHIVKEQQITIIQATPITYKMMLAAGWEQALPVKVICGGEPMSKDLAEKLLARCTSLYNMYGPTETTVYSTGKQILPGDKIISIGTPINNTQIYILDEELQAVAEGAAGEIYISGDGVGGGYLNLPELTSQKFIDNPFSFAGGKMYKTGDLGKYVANGEIQCLGRIDRQIKVRGFRIEPGEIESAITRHCSCAEVLVIAQQDDRLHPTLVACLVFENPADKNNFSPIVGRLKYQLKAELPAYMIPDHFIGLAQLPLLPNGKIDYKAIPRVHTQTIDKDESEYSEAEKLVSNVWRHFLGTKNIGINDNFFLLGGHSMIAVEVMVRLEKETGIKLPLSSLFEYPTIKEFATLLRGDNKESIWKSLVPIKSTGTKMPVYVIHGSGSNIMNFSSFASHMDADQPVYGLQAKGLNGLEEPLSSMEEIASTYITEVIKHNPTGPYAIAGYSFGGYVAIEMARQLRLMGKEVKMLGMFDTNAKEHFWNTSFHYKIFNKLVRQLKKGIWISTGLMTQPKATINYQLLYLSNKMKAIGYSLGLLKVVEAETYLSELIRISERNDIAYNNYRMMPFDGKIDLFKAKERVYFVDDFKLLGWKKYALQGVRVHEVPGDHKTMLAAPNDKVFASVLQQALDNCH